MIVGEQMVRQCKCDEVAPCIKAAEEAFVPCADNCQKFITTIGGNYQQIRNCFMKKKPIIDKAMKCSRDSFPDACTRGTPKMIPRRYAKGIEIAAVNAINKELQKMGISDQLTTVFAQGRRFFKCSQSCMKKKLGKCATGCGLNLPSDNVVIQTVKTCGVRSGIQTSAVQELCFCIEKAGIRQLAGICPRIRIFETKH
ncbi:hypothetical protein LOAG_04202 [Loa loa]|uniref:DB domain-containing protein n=1 Tax=Loa loa TaxID=7209 RepID=A0A1I7W5J1_LOALO|nr:hypothetical protein LOAG_04202 [Loa loa]EFO24285.1 hypothetical protein LOAG_04202 [Loa loa]